MMKALIKKQFLESFRSYFVNPKTNKRRSKGGIIGFFAFFAVAMLSLFAIFFALANMLSPMLEQELAWLYYALMGIVSIALGVFGSVFNTYAGLYLAKDNELLLSMPIKPSGILLSRMALVEGLSLLYSGIVWAPALLCSWITKTPSVLEVLFGVLLFLVISLFVTAATCVLGWVIAAIASRVKKRSFIVVILSVTFFSLYYLVVMRMTEYMEGILMQSQSVGAALEKWGNLFYQLGSAATGKVLPMLLFTAISVAFCAACLLVMSRSFLSIATRTSPTEKASAGKVKIKATDRKAALFRREGKRFLSSPGYMLNCGLGILVLPVIVVIFLIKNSQLQPLLAEAFAEMPELEAFVPFAVFGIIGLVISINVISTPSVSLEGKSIWILQSLPIRAADVLLTKVKFHFFLNAIPVWIAGAVLCVLLHMDLLSTGLVLLALTVFLWLSGSFGMVVGVLHSNVAWVNETVPLKGLNVLLVMLANWIIVAAICAIFWPLRKMLTAQMYFLICIAVMAAFSLFLYKWIKTKGAERFAHI